MRSDDTSDLWELDQESSGGTGCRRILSVVVSLHHSSSERAYVKLIESSRNLSVNAFHEKAGRSQGNSGFIVSSWFFSLTKFFSHRVATVAMLPFALSRSDLVARCMLGVLNSAGAAICLATCHFT